MPRLAWAERWAEAERNQLPLWVPVMLGAGIACWFVLPDPRAWIGMVLGLAGIGLAAVTLADGGRVSRMVAIAAFLMSAGVLLAWARADSVRAAVLQHPAIATMVAEVEGMDRLAARRIVRLMLHPLEARDGRDRPIVLPPRIRVSLHEEDAVAGLGAGARIRLRARLMPPAGPVAPGGHDFARAAWFQGIGATGRGFAPVGVMQPAPDTVGLRQRLSARITSRIAGSAGGIAAALATGDVGAIEDGDAEAMRRAGLAHLLSVSGLHITAVVGIVMVLTVRLLALWPWLALRVRLPLVGAAAGALAAIGYTWLTGAEVPTIRSCVAAMLVLAALALGREAMTLRLVAAGALIVLVFRPEALVGASFQLSFAAITAIVALHDHPAMRRWFGPHPDWRWSMLRHLAALLVTGLVVEAALMPIAIFHFHKAGLYGAMANIIAIPWTTFVAMPLEMMALLLEPLGLGAPFWWMLERSLGLLLALAHHVAVMPGAVVALPVAPVWAFAAALGGGLWVALWRTGWRWSGMPILAMGFAVMLAAPAPDLIVTGDGRHVAVSTSKGVALLRDRAGDYMRSTLSEMGGSDAEPQALADQPGARCGQDMCVTRIATGGRLWQVAATRSGYAVPWDDLIALCSRMDIVIADRRLPAACHPHWLKLDTPALRRTGGLAIRFDPPRVDMVRQPGDRHPWVEAAADPASRPQS
ncbi:ComEC family competence protein [Sphingomonas sanguinis]|uniref:ComEC/Rec2 family competence protein n=1 Tax=Sphingomonas sp. LC-1 TaxID=3110957 RepID=UPI0021BB5E88|nr:ComEC/Rec2 family competence protein [Sphingomonas sp. LC-1]MCT8000667.1 ComEC family competence protein [Sphingomonas sp. LC-1]